MESFLSAVLGELASRSINFIISKISKPKVLEVEDRLERTLLRAQVIVDEATGRSITNQAMLQQLDMLRDAIYRGCYMLDTFRYQSHGVEDDKDQMELELVINFLLNTQPHGSEELEVLPIVGPCKVGKSTLVAHVCKNERVRDHFSEILFLHSHDFTDDNLSLFRGCAMRHQNHISNKNKDRGCLVVIDLVGDLNEDVWNVLYSSCKQRMPRTSKIIITSRSAKITKVGTTQALNLKYLSHEAFWYFLKIVIFGSMDPEMHPRFVQVAIEISNILDRELIAASVVGRLLRDNFDIHFWCKVLAFLRRIIYTHISKFGVRPIDFISQNKHVHLGRMAAPFQDLVLYCEHQSSSQEDVPKIRLADVMYGSVTALGKLEFLVWISPIPPYYSYVVTCEVREPKRRAAKRKRSIENGTTLC
ncbi:putative disease resistance protein RGA3 [Setaria viridis]|uniref:NB-ARC domain-containing protein n=1 Tax=Setaria viridis TaxID=4556 RepID=A0A4U6VQI5_SETVI|nr:putative disease resistance protein RGA3 [Setaria viridis]TKW30763.1 hypothetical protein SEVIR_2G059400v2 [Setaria viridis]